jgi:hypothetical protein
VLIKEVASASPTIVPAIETMSFSRTVGDQIREGLEFEECTKLGKAFG